MAIPPRAKESEPTSMITVAEDLAAYKASRHALVSHSYAAFRADVAAFLARHRDSEMLIVGASRGAADDLLWTAAPAGWIGVHRFTPAQVAAVLAAPTLADRGLKVANLFASEAVAARVVHELRQKQCWKYFGPVAGTPGFARA